MPVCCPASFGIRTVINPAVSAQFDCVVFARTEAETVSDGPENVLLPVKVLLVDVAGKVSVCPQAIPPNKNKLKKRERSSLVRVKEEDLDIFMRRGRGGKL